MLRTHTCGELNGEYYETHSGFETLSLCGWVDAIRKHKETTFVDLRDRYGKIQLVIKEESNLNLEDVIQATGTLQKRTNPNNKIPTGAIEILVNEIKIFNKAKSPFALKQQKDVFEDLKLKHRYFQLRDFELQNNLILKHKVIQDIRRWLSVFGGFIEIDTPILTKSTPEGARDFLVPSRIHKGKYYALPQSPQIYKQLLMVAGMDKYFQICKCFRDETIKGDRQPEFQQIDLEMSFVTQNDIFQIVCGIINGFKGHFGDKVQDRRIIRMTYDEAMTKYGTDKPNIGDFVWVTDFPLFKLNKETGCLESEHHPFTSPRDEDVAKLLSNDVGSNESLLKLRAKCFDLVWNGVELGSGSIRIHNAQLQSVIFHILGYEEKEITDRFGFLLEALESGAPPHGGIALGIDRMLAVATGSDSIKDFIAFPKTVNGYGLMENCPSEISKEQLNELKEK